MESFEFTKTAEHLIKEAVSAKLIQDSIRRAEKLTKVNDKLSTKTQKALRKMQDKGTLSPEVGDSMRKVIKAADKKGSKYFGQKHRLIEGAINKFGPIDHWR